MAVATWDLHRRNRAGALSGTDLGLRLPALRPALDGPWGGPGRGAAVPRITVPARVRRRLAALVLLLAVVALAASAVPRGGLTTATARPTPAAVPAAAAAQPYEPTVVIGPGETVWELAAPHAPAGTDLHVYVAEVLHRNGLEATAIPPGTVIRMHR